jgi:hypothetical protein
MEGMKRGVGCVVWWRVEEVFVGLGLSIDLAGSAGIIHMFHHIFLNLLDPTGFIQHNIYPHT